MPVDFSVTNQLASPAIYASSFATRPAASFKGRLFIDTDVISTGIYRDTGTAWVAIAGTGVAETQNLNQVCTIGNTTTTLGIIINGQSSYGEDTTAPFGQLLPFGNYALSIGAYSEFDASLYVKNDALFVKDILVNDITVGRGGGNEQTNTVFGKLALSSNSVGIRNTAIGVSTLKTNANGNENTGVGFRTLEFVESGSYNIAIGGGSGSVITEGEGNTLLGYNTNVDENDDSYNVVIGANTVAPNGNYQFVVGNATQNAGAVTTEVNASSRVWNVTINGVNRKILLA